jgi:hypothetical protein
MTTEQLYRIKYSGDIKLNTYAEMLIDHKMLVPVQKCVHGRIDAHWGPHYVADASGHDREYREWCRGAMPRVSDDD